MIHSVQVGPLFMCMIAYTAQLLALEFCCMLYHNAFFLDHRSHGI